MIGEGLQVAEGDYPERSGDVTEKTLGVGAVGALGVG
jgi:hypothetical protein